MPELRFEGIDSSLVASRLPADPIVQTSPLLDLPLEIGRQIVREASEITNQHGFDFHRETLRSLATTCRMLCDLAQPYLLSQVIVSNSERLEAIISWTEKIDAPESNPIQAIEFYFIGPGGGPTILSHNRVAALLAALPKLKRLYVRRVASTVIVRALAISLASLASLEHLRVDTWGKDANNSPEGIGCLLDCVQGLTRLQHIQLQDFLNESRPFRDSAEPFAFRPMTLQTSSGPRLREVNLEVSQTFSPNPWLTLLGPSWRLRCVHMPLNRSTASMIPLLPCSVVALSLKAIGTSEPVRTSDTITTISLTLSLHDDFPLHIMPHRSLLQGVKNLVLRFIAHPGDMGWDKFDDCPLFQVGLYMVLRGACELPLLEHLVIDVQETRGDHRIVETIRMVVEMGYPSFKVTWSSSGNLDLLALEDHGSVIGGFQTMDLPPTEWNTGPRYSMLFWGPYTNQ